MLDMKRYGVDWFMYSTGYSQCVRYEKVYNAY